MRIEGERVEAVFLRRLNRFACELKLRGRTVHAHLANSGRLRELLVPGREALLVRRSSPTRKTDYDLALIRYRRAWVSMDARKPGPLLLEAVRAGSLEAFSGHVLRRTEPPVPPAEAGKYRDVHGRFDLLLEGPKGLCYVETKSCTLVRNGRGLFPDAVTERGARHLRELADLAKDGTETALVFVVQRPDVRDFAPHWQSDPTFARELVAAYAAGVRVLAYRCRVTTTEVVIAEAIPVVLEP